MFPHETPNQSIRQARILVVDDEPANVMLLERMLERAGYERVRSTTRPEEVVRAMAEFSPDLLLLDVHMPQIDGLSLLLELAPWVGGAGGIPVIMLTGDGEPQTRRLALERGARDFLSKPLDLGEVLLRIRNMLETRVLQLQIQKNNENLERAVRARTLDLEEAQLELVERLALAAEYRDDETHEHAHRVGRTAALLAERLGLGPGLSALIRRAAPLHDVGKIGITDAVFRKPGRLSEEETAIMRQHVQVGSSILADSSSAVLRLAEEIARTHHERWDGTGYPNGLQGEEIPVSGRLVAVADVFDALTHERPYKQAWPLDDAVAEILAGAGGHFDPAVVEAFSQIDHAHLLTPVAATTVPGPAGTTQRVWDPAAAGSPAG